jgi:hypothetical protein
MERRANEQRETLQRRALEMLRSRRTGAAAAVQRRAKLYEGQADRAVAALLNVEHALELIESSVANSQILSALKQGNDVLKTQRVDIDELDSVLEDMAENVESDRQVQDSLVSAQRSSLLPVEALDDDALLEELMQSLALDDSPTPPPAAPAVGTPAAASSSVSTSAALHEPVTVTQSQSESNTAVGFRKASPSTMGELIAS